MNNFRRLLTARRDAAMANQDKGFTLIELLVVILIIGVLAAIAIPIFIAQQNQAAEAGVKADLANAKIAYVSALVSAPTTVPSTTDLTTYGYTSTTTVTITAATDPKTFCLQATGGGSTWGITSTGGVAKGTCAAGVFTAAS